MGGKHVYRSISWITHIRGIAILQKKGWDSNFSVMRHLGGRAKLGKYATALIDVKSQL